tara:strand:+ start:200 stop:493 length:294 start_codon:yes stop_codon:yes gene_type:complete
VWCGEDDPDTLTVDHVDSDGNTERKERKQLGISKLTAIRREPWRFQVLCASCNQKKKKVIDISVQRRRREEQVRVKGAVFGGLGGSRVLGFLRRLGF